MERNQQQQRPQPMSELTRGIEKWTAERKHHPFSPSSLQNREACPCYAGRDSQHVRSIAGSLAHSVVETRRDHNELSDEDAVSAAECIDFIDGRFAMMKTARELAIQRQEGPFHSRATAEESVPQVQEFREIELAIDDCKFEDADSTTSGFLDTLLIDHTGEYAEMADWKFGVWPVEPAKTNLQCICYVLGGFRHFPKLKSIRFFFRQPLIGLNSDHTFHRSEIPELYLRIQTVVHRARKATAQADAEDFSEAIPKIPACNFCARLGDCPKVLDIMCKVGAKFHPMEIPADITPTKVLAKDQTAFGLRLSGVVKIWADAFRASTTDRVLRGAADLPEGFTIQSSSRRELIDKEKFKQVAMDFLTEAEFSATLDVLFGAVEKAIQDKAPRGQKKHTTEIFQERLAECGATAKGQPFSFLRAKAASKD